MAKNGIPASFVTMRKEDAQREIDKCQDVLSGEHVKAEALYRQHVMCPNGCGNTMEKHFGGSAFAFSDPNWLIPRCLMKCHACACTINPFDGMLVERGDKNKAVYGDVPILNPNDDSR